MKKVFRYTFAPNSIRDGAFEFSVKMPKGAVVLCVNLGTDGKPSLWAEVDPNNEMEEVPFYSIGTGHGAVPDNSKYVGTIVDEAFVWHIYLPWSSSKGGCCGK